MLFFILDRETGEMDRAKYCTILEDETFMCMRSPISQTYILHQSISNFFLNKKKKGKNINL